MAVRPKRVFAFRRACFVEQARLRGEDIRSLGMGPDCDRRFRGCHLFRGPRDVDGCSLGALGCRPRHRPIEGPIDLEYARTIAELLQPRAVRLRQVVACDPQKLRGGDIEEGHSVGGKLLDRLDRPSGGDGPSERLKVRGQCL
jgi:hypothetical protein